MLVSFASTSSFTWRIFATMSSKASLSVSQRVRTSVSVKGSTSSGGLGASATLPGWIDYLVGLLCILPMASTPFFRPPLALFSPQEYKSFSIHHKTASVAFSMQNEFV